MSKKNYIPKQMKTYVYKRDGRQCRYCGDTKGQFHLDHVYPESKGGITKASNLVVSCSSCNHKEHAKVGLWPYPIGYFNRPKNHNRLLIWVLLMLLFTSLFGLGLAIDYAPLYLFSVIPSIGFTFSVVTY